MLWLYNALLSQSTIHNINTNLVQFCFVFKNASKFCVPYPKFTGTWSCFGVFFFFLLLLANYLCCSFFVCALWNDFVFLSSVGHSKYLIDEFILLVFIAIVGYVYSFLITHFCFSIPLFKVLHLLPCLHQDQFGYFFSVIPSIAIFLTLNINLFIWLCQVSFVACAI